MAQLLKFAELYRKNKEAVENTLKGLWCGEARNESQRAYIKQLTEEIIPGIFAPEEAAPLVQCMNNYAEVKAEHREDCARLAGEWWKKASGGNYEPYEHQYRCWKTLLEGKTKDGENRSIVVTTGTGSGKTECFMLPLVKDLSENWKKDTVQAIFIYPLNALMEDQKERLEKLVAGTNLKYAVFNGNMPEGGALGGTDEWEEEQRKIRAIRGITVDENGNESEPRYPNAIATRRELRKHPANILLTNPTMLEYMLLRREDSPLITAGALRWIALDETHTYTGSGAAEMAMLIRRVLMAYGVGTDTVRFATSSATIGSGEDGEEELRKFICGITGLKPEQVECVDGERKGLGEPPEGDFKEQWELLARSARDGEGYIKLDDLMAGWKPKNTEEALGWLDVMADELEEAGRDDYRIKVHYFYRVPNFGLYMDFGDVDYLRAHGCFKLYPANNRGTVGEEGKEEEKAPLLEMRRCKHCGEYLGIAEEVKCEEGAITLKALTNEDSDMFELEEEGDDRAVIYVLAASNDEGTERDGNVAYRVDGGKLLNPAAGNRERGDMAGRIGADGPEWHLVANVQKCCPHCGTKLMRSASDPNDPDGGEETEEDARKTSPFRVSPEYVSQILAPGTLDLMEEAAGPERLHRGQQYISFVDSRHNAARATMRQNLEEEKLWVYGRIYHELCRRATEGMTREDAIAHLTKMADGVESLDDRIAILQKARVLQGNDEAAIEAVMAELRAGMGEPRLSWAEILRLLENDPVSEKLYDAFSGRSERGAAGGNGGQGREADKKKYLLSIMTELLTKRPLRGASPETAGLFTSHFAKLEGVEERELPEGVEAFNREVGEEWAITGEDWRNLLKIFLDFTVRTGESVYLDMGDNSGMDIHKCLRFATRKASRRPVRKPEAEHGTRSRVVRLLGELLAESKGTTVKDAIAANGELVNGVLDDLWNDLTVKYRLLNWSTSCIGGGTEQVPDREPDTEQGEIEPYRLNLADLGFTLYRKVWLCNVESSGTVRAAVTKRPFGELFHGYSPYPVRGEVVKPEAGDHEEWEAFGGHAAGGDGGNRWSLEKIRAWAKEKRRVLWENGLWGDSGTFTVFLDELHRYPELFVQGEHTAQVDKLVAREIQRDFKAHKINILACSTTMEMGVDLGDLELVMMNSVPPHPSNYKQRAGRSGRREQARSACVTLCGSDAIGVRTLYHAMESLINRKTSCPTVDLQSRQVIQRHVNSFLLREFGIMAEAWATTKRVLDYYTRYAYSRANGMRDGARDVNPTDGLGEEEGTKYEWYNTRCDEPLSDALNEKLQKLLRGTAFENRAAEAVRGAKERNIACRKLLAERVEQYKEPYEEAVRVNRERAMSFFRIKHQEALTRRALDFWAAYQFIPNANMPVNVVTFDVGSAIESERVPRPHGHGVAMLNNPTYSLQTALGQYAPGNAVPRDGVVRVVRGVRYTNFFRQNVGFMKLYFDGNRVAVDTTEGLDQPKKWLVNGEEGLELLRPLEFMPDINESQNRMLEKNTYTRVSAQLTGAGEWAGAGGGDRLIDVRTSDSNPEAQILYYNEGTGHGYCYCNKCGRAVLESWAARTSNNPEIMPREFNPVESADGKRHYHYQLGKKGKECNGSNDPKKIRRNVVLGDFIKTDYAEIRIRRESTGDWIANRGEENNPLLVTMGVLMARALADELNIERQDIDMFVTPNGHVCIFDTNPGGAGYSNQLKREDLLLRVLDGARNLLRLVKESGTMDAILERSVMRHYDKLDIAAAEGWLTSEKASRRELPKEVAKAFPGAQVASMRALKEAFREEAGQKALFADNEYKAWNYRSEAEGARSWFGLHFGDFNGAPGNTKFCIAENDVRNMPEPVKMTADNIRGWTSGIVRMTNPYRYKKLYPLAYIGGRLYFTDEKSGASLNEDWGAGVIYSAAIAETDKFAELVGNAEEVDKARNEETTRILMVPQGERVSTRGFGRFLEEYDESTKALFGKFFDYCESNPGKKLEICYQDEHLKSMLGIVYCIQIIDYFVRRVGAHIDGFSLSFKLEKYKEANEAERITDNLKNEDRDRFLKRMVRDFLTSANNDGLNGRMERWESLDGRALPHWRELTLRYGEKTLTIYPDGGFMNGWRIGWNPRFIGPDNISWDTEVNLVSGMEIKYDIVVG